MIILLPLAAYLLGSIPFGLLLTRMFSDIDIRGQGSGNIGATNVTRLAGVSLGVATLASDLLKGALPVILCNLAAPTPTMKAAAALSAFLGHLFPVYTRWRGGGKGVATAAGAFAAISPLAVVAALAMFLLTGLITRRVSVGSLCGALALPPALWWATHSGIYTLCAVLASGLIVLRHRENIRRLASGTEPPFRIGSRRQNRS